MANDKSNITVGLPKPGGAIYFAPAGTAIPTDATTDLPAAFVNLGYVTEDGLTASTKEDGDDLKAWGPEIVGRNQTSYARTFTFNLLETARVAALQFRYGTGNVTVGAGGDIKVNDTGEPAPRGVFVVDTLQNNGETTPRIRRQIAGDAQLVDRSGDQVFNNSDAVNIPATIMAYKYTASGVTNANGDYVTEFVSPLN